MKGLDEIVNLDALGQAELVRKKEIKPLELMDGAIQRIERLNPTLNAVVTPMYEYARKQASAAVAEGLFGGVPFLLKDFLAEFAGVRFTEGTAFLRDYVPTEDSELVKRYKKAGLIIVEKLTPLNSPWCYYRTSPLRDPLIILGIQGERRVAQAAGPPALLRPGSFPWLTGMMPEAPFVYLHPAVESSA